MAGLWGLPWDRYTVQGPADHSEPGTQLSIQHDAVVNWESTTELAQNRAIWTNHVKVIP